MNMVSQPARPLSAHEELVLRAAIERSPAVADASEFLATLAKLIVVRHCSCQCGSVEFHTTPEHAVQRYRIVAKALGRTAKDGELGVTVWGTTSVLTGFEIDDLGAGEMDNALPTPASIRPWDGEDET